MRRQSSSSNGSRGTAVVTGGGGAIAVELAQRLEATGYRLVLAGPTRSKLEASAAHLRHEPLLVDCDLATGDGISRFARTIERDHDDLTLLVNNAGHIEPGRVIDIDEASIERHIAINLVAPMQLTRTVARSMARHGRGDILSILSMGAILALRGSASYSAAKFGLRGFNTAVRQELAPLGVRVMGVFPSGVDTPMLHREAVHPDGSPLNFVGKVMTPAHVADVCMKALRTGRLETYVPYGDSVSTRLVGAWPWSIARIEPFFARIGRRGRDRFVADRGLEPHDVTGGAGAPVPRDLG